MKRSPSSLTRADLVLLHEALSYARKRVFLPAESIRLQGILDRVEELLLRAGAGDPGVGGAEDGSLAVRLRLSPPEREILEKEIANYSEALRQRGGSAAGAEEAARLRLILDRIAGHRPPWWRRFLQG